METLEVAETLAVGPQTTPPPKPQTLETPGESRSPHPIRDDREPECRVSPLGLGLRPSGSSDAAGEKPVAVEDLAGHEKLAVVNAGEEEGAGELPATNYAAAEFLRRLRGAALDFSISDTLEIGPDVSEELNQRKRRRGMAKLTAEMGDDATEAELNQGENKKDTDLDDGGVAEEGTTSSQRERKKSKYLSPPYTNSSGYGKWSALIKDAELEMPGKDSEAARPLIPRSTQKVHDMMSPSSIYDGDDVNVILSELLSTAINPLHMEWNSSVKTVRGFFAEFRSSVISIGWESENYKVHLVDSDGIDGEFVDAEMGDGSKEGKSVRKRNKRKDGANGKAPLNLSHDTAEQGKARQRRKVMKDGADGESPVNLALVVANSLEGKSTDGANGKIVLDSGGHKPIICSEDRLLKKRNKSKGAANGGTPVDSGYDPIGFSGEVNLGQKMKKSNDKPNSGLQVSLARKSTNGSKGGRSRQKRRVEEALSGSPAALILTFTPGTTLPSKDELISKFRPYGDLIEPKAELLKDSSSARILFARSSEAEKAFNSPDKRSAFGSPLASCRLRYLPENMPSPSPPQPVKKSPLPYIRKSLAMMISTLTGSSSVEKGARSPGWLKLEGMKDLVGNMKGLLQKVDELMTGPPAATSS